MFGGLPEVEGFALHVVESFGQDRGKIGVFRADVDLPVPEARSPQWGDLLSLGDWAANLQGEIDAQAGQGPLTILLLTPSFAGLGRHAGGLVDQPDGCLDLVAMLSSGAASA